MSGLKEFDLYAYWYYSKNAYDYGLGGWICNKCNMPNMNLPNNKRIDPMLFNGSKYCPNCGKKMKSKLRME